MRIHRLLRKSIYINHTKEFLNYIYQAEKMGLIKRLLCNRILRQASVNLEEDDKFHFTPHKLRHTFLKKAADKHGLHFAHEASGNVSIKEIFRYAKPSQEEIDEAVEELFSG